MGSEIVYKRQLQGVTSVSGGNVAAHLSVMTATATDDNVDGGIPRSQQQQQQQLPTITSTTAESGADVFSIPRLTDAEKASPIGNSLGSLLGLFHSLKQQLDLQRSQQPRQLVAEPSLATAAAAVPDDEPSVTDSRTVAAAATAASSSTAATAAAGNNNRSSLETSSRMKREMESQMAFQNKMRALKQHELEKLADMTTTTEPAVAATKTAEDDDFWNAEVLDGDLFQFLMDP